MPRTSGPATLSGTPRTRKTPPHIALGDLRAAVGLTLDQVIERLKQETGREYTRGAISAIENGHRGASAQLLQALCAAYGLRTGAIVTDYQPRNACEGGATEDVA